MDPVIFEELFKKYFIVLEFERASFDKIVNQPTLVYWTRYLVITFSTGKAFTLPIISQCTFLIVLRMPIVIVYYKL